MRDDDRVDTLRVLPHSIEAEQAVIGGLMLAADALPKIADWLTVSDFFRRDHQAIYQAIIGLDKSGQPFDVLTLSDWLNANGLGRDIGDGYLIELVGSTPSAANIVAHAEIVREKSILRALIQTGADAANSGMNPNGQDAQQLVADTMRKLTRLSLADRSGGLEPPKPLLAKWFETLRQRWESGDRMTGLPTPWKLVNDLTFGLQRADLIVVGARPAMGKSVLGFNLAAFTALRGDRVALFSLEMSSEQVMQRMASALYEIPHDWLRSPASSDEDHWGSVNLAVRDLAAAQLLIDDEPALTIAQITARAKRAHAQSPLRLVVVDHLHIIRRAGRNPVEEIGEISRGLKALAKSLQVPVVVLAQLNRANAGQRPTLIDLRASGDIEQDADLIFLMHRQDYYDKSHTSKDVELIVGKGRNMPQGQTLTLANRFDVMRLDDWQGPLPVAQVDDRSHRGKEETVRRWAGVGNVHADRIAGADR